MRLLIFLYGLVSYALFLGVFLYTIGFVGGFYVPRSMDEGEVVGTTTALLINAGLLAVFAIQHTIMARPAFKAWWTRIIPAAAERSTFVMITNLLLIAMFFLWQPMPDTVWVVEGAFANVLWGVFGLGWLMVLVSTFLINHFDLFGLSQVTAYLRGQEYHGPRFVERGMYRMVRHPIMLGFVIAFWATPVMSQGHLFFAAMCTAYIFIGVRIEESTLVHYHGDTYRSYQSRVPGILPLRPGKKA